MASGLKQQIQTTFKLSGIQLRLEAARYLTDQLQSVPIDDRETWLDKIIDAVQKQELKSSLVDKAAVSKALQDRVNEALGEEKLDVLNVISAFETPRLSYSVERKKYLSDVTLGRPAASLYGSADAKADVYLQRYRVLHQRTARHDLFCPTATGHIQDSKKFQLKTVEYLLGTNARLDDVIVLGMLCLDSPGKYSLEDPTGLVPLDLSAAKFHTGLFVESSFVLAEGWYDDGVFHILALGFPPAEPAETTRAYFGNINFFGGSSETGLKNSTRLAERELEDKDAMFVFISDVWLDKVEVLDRLRKLFSGYSEFPPTAFVLMGNLLSCTPAGGGASYVNGLREGLRQLGEILSQHKQILDQSQIMLVPGPADPGSANIFPRPPIPNYIGQELKNLVPKAQFLTNPARIQYCTQEIVVFREDIVTKLCRNTIYYPEAGEISDHFCKTITSQGHLTPLPLYACPVYWHHDRALQLYPLPDLVVVGDKYQPFTATNLGCTVVNPGTFAKHEFSFKTYIPSEKAVEDSLVPDDD